MNSMASRGMTPLGLLCLEFPQPDASLDVLEADMSSVRDRHTVRVASQIRQHVVEGAEARLGIDHPLLDTQTDSRE
jgi:hypothetical protein